MTVMKTSKSKLVMGRGASASCLLNKLHPSKLVRESKINYTAQDRISNLCVVKKEMRIVNRRQQEVIVCRHDDWPNQEIYAVKMWMKVEVQGSSCGFFNEDRDEANEEEAPCNEEDDERSEMPHTLQCLMQKDTLREDDPDLLNVIEDGTVEVDMDTAPAPENIPGGKGTNGDVEMNAVGWSDLPIENICDRRAGMRVNCNAKLALPGNNLNPGKVGLFEKLFPQVWVKTVLIPKTNMLLTKHEEGIVANNLDYGEFLQFVGILLVISSSSTGHTRRDYWATKPHGQRQAPFKFNKYMSRNRFEAIQRNLQFTDEKKPTYKDPFWEVRQMIDAWNSNMEIIFIPSFISCLDESMSKWLNQFTCPGFMVVPRKPWPFGNEWHSICCGKSGVMYAIELVEGKSEPKERKKEFSEKGKTVGLVLRLTKSIWNRGSIVIMDSGFCVVKAIVELLKHGVYASAVIKKRRYWPRYIDGKQMNEFFADKESGYVQVKKQMLDGIEYKVYAMKEANYVSSFMTTYGTVNRCGKVNVRTYKDTTSGQNKTVKFQYPEVVHNHFQYRDAVDSHNRKRMDPIAIEEQLKTNRWQYRVFQFILAVTEVNVNLCLCHFYHEPAQTQIDFRYELGMELINNDYLENKEEKKKYTVKKRSCNQEKHCHVSIPRKKTFHGIDLVRCKTEYIQLQCSGCRKRTRKYCACTPGRVLCDICFQKHILEAHGAV
jgi:hypothetical protein